MYGGHIEVLPTPCVVLTGSVSGIEGQSGLTPSAFWASAQRKATIMLDVVDVLYRRINSILNRS